MERENIAIIETSSFVDIDAVKMERRVRKQYVQKAKWGHLFLFLTPYSLLLRVISCFFFVKKGCIVAIDLFLSRKIVFCAWGTRFKIMHG